MSEYLDTPFLYDNTRGLAPGIYLSNPQGHAVLADDKRELIVLDMGGVIDVGGTAARRIANLRRAADLDMMQGGFTVDATTMLITWSDYARLTITVLWPDGTLTTGQLPETAVDLLDGRRPAGVYVSRDGGELEQVDCLHDGDVLRLALADGVDAGTVIATAEY